LNIETTAKTATMPHRNRQNPGGFSPLRGSRRQLNPRSMAAEKYFVGFYFKSTLGNGVALA